MSAPTLDLPLAPPEPDDDDDDDPVVELARAGRAHALRALARYIRTHHRVFGARFVLLYG
jgi:hypothetical protein